MTRWTILAMIGAVVACGEGERDQLSRAASDTVVVEDTALASERVADPGATDTGAAARRNTGAGTTADTATTRPGTAVADKDKGPTGAEAMGGVRAPTPPAAGGARALDLTRSQVTQLQVALNDAGCDAGSADGVIGARTRRAIACGMEKHNLERNDFSGLYRALDLDF